MWNKKGNESIGELGKITKWIIYIAIALIFLFFLFKVIQSNASETGNIITWGLGKR